MLMKNDRSDIRYIEAKVISVGEEISGLKENDSIKKYYQNLFHYILVDDYQDIMNVFKTHKEIFPHIRGDKIQKLIDSKNVVWENGVLITWNRYKRKQRIGNYQGQKGDCILHQIAARDQGNGSAKKVFEKFIWDGNKNSDVILSVRSSNKRARKFLKKSNLDYAHGTGHGVGFFLNVHEGPQSINKINKVKIKPGMVLSNEPGYYKKNHFGIRIENLVYVDKKKEK